MSFTVHEEQRVRYRYEVRWDGGKSYCRCDSKSDADAIALALNVVRLTASAPDMLAALKNFVAWHAEHFEDFDSEVNAQLLCLANDAAAVIAEAE